VIDPVLLKKSLFENQVLEAFIMIFSFPSNQLLRSSLVNNRTQSVVCDDLGMTVFVSTQDDSKTKEMKMKEKADLLEAFIGALYVDKGLEFCRVFAQVCFFPRLKVRHFALLTQLIPPQGRHFGFLAVSSAQICRLLNLTTYFGTNLKKHCSDS
jgi:hypothetical protein